ncbi:MAG TPA: APC family permease, partial [Candidatus Elarobacter sp.]|nr:APC family permease [Candidatus Elarobacter sp.]
MTGHPVERRRLLRVLGVGFGVAAVIGGTIGFGILRTPGLVAARLPDPWLILGVWALGGVYALLDANCTTELTTLMPEAGGPYVFARAAYGDFTGFVIGLGDWLQNTVALALVGVSLAEYVGVLAPPLAGAVGPVAAAVLAALTAVQLLGVRVGSVVQQWSSTAKTLAFAVLIGALFWAGGGASVAPAAPVLVRPHGAWMILLGVVASFRAVVSTYGGWNTAIYFSEEDVDPGRNLPRALIGGLLLVVAIYMLTNLALLHVLTPAQIAASSLPVAAAAQAVFGGATGRVITALALVSLLSILNATVLLTPRVLYGLGRDGLAPAAVTRVSRGGTPVTATLLSGGIAIMLALAGTFEALLAAYALVGVLIGVVVNASLFTLRRRWPERARPYRARGYPWT